MAKRNSDEDFEGCGISSIIATHEDDPFYQACRRHDNRYLFSGEKRDPVKRREVDRDFFNDMIRIAEARKSRYLKVKAYVYYGVARAFGGWFWD